VIGRLAAAGLDLAAPFPEAGKLGLVVGNTRALWPRFRAWLDGGPRGPNPLERYVAEAVRGAVSGLACTVRFAHHGPPWLPIQRIAERAGLAWLAPSNLCVHPVYGPWISLRAVVVADQAAPPEPSPAPACGACPHACLPAFERARATLDPSDPAGSARASWPAWLAVRDACPIGREHRFQEDHIRYGYAGSLPMMSAERRDGDEL